jgi:hypothetical protein
MASSDALGRDPRLLLLNPGDNVLVARSPIAAGEAVLVDGTVVSLGMALELGHKLARHPISPGAAITKYGMPIGYATAAIATGAHVHLHNVRSGYTRSIALDSGVAGALAGSDGPGPYTGDVTHG